MEAQVGPLGYEVLLGTYEAFVLGYKIERADEVQPGESEEQPRSRRFKLTTSIADHAHSSCVRTLAAGDKYLVTCGDDENVKVFNLRNRTQHGSLTHSDGSPITCATFYDRRHLITGSGDGKICVIRALASSKSGPSSSGWNVEKTLLKHRDSVVDFAVHPSGKLMISVGKDGKLVTWNLIKGRSAYVTNLSKDGFGCGSSIDLVRWSPSGNHYAVGLHRRVDIYATKDASVHLSLPFKGRCNDLTFLDDGHFALASGDSPNVQIYSLDSTDPVQEFPASAGSRVRCLALISEDNAGNKIMERNKHQFLVTATSDGVVKLWTVTWKPDKEGQAERPAFFEEATVHTNCRITCMTAHKVPEVKRPDQSSKAEITKAKVMAKIKAVKQAEDASVGLQGKASTKRKTLSFKLDETQSISKVGKDKVLIEDERSTMAMTKKKRRKQ